MQASDSTGQTSPLEPVLLAKKRKVPACILSRADLIRLYDQLSRKLEEEGENRIAQLIKPPEYSDEAFAAFKKTLYDLYKITVTINSVNGESTAGHSKKVIDEIPSEMNIASIHFNSQALIQQTHNVQAKNRFEVFLDFSKPDALDISKPASDPTPNVSAFQVLGEDDTWVRGVYDQINSFFEPKRTNRNWFHKTGIYDVTLWLAVIPVLIFAILKISTMYESYFSNISAILNTALGIYFVLFSALLYRLVFAYTKWIFPLVELSDIGRGVSRAHRRTWWWLMGGIVVALVSPLVLPLISRFLSFGP